MAQQSKFVDLTRTYLPIDPSSLPENLSAPQQDYDPEKRIPVMAYEGHNFMPTAQGYRSYFGTGASVDLLPLTSACDYIFIYQRQDYTNFFVALCADGIWTNQGTSQEAWTHAITETVLSDETDYLAWSYCVIGTTLYMYRQGDAVYYRIQVDAEVVATVSYAAYQITPITPSFLNMAGQIGIFKAGGRLGFWDSDNAVGWSAFEDLTDFVPAIKTQANVTKFVDVVGRITTIRQHGDGFIIYATKSIVWVYKDLTNTFLWKTEVLSTNAGVAYAKQVAVANPDTIHFAGTSTSFIQITNGKIEVIGPELFDFTKQSPEPILLSIVQGRYLFLEMMNAEFLAAQVSVTAYSFPATIKVLTDPTPARHILIDGKVIPGAEWTIPGYPGVAGQAGVDDIPGQAEIPGFPGIPGTDGKAAIPDKQIAETWNTLRSAEGLGQIASPFYRTEGKVWPEYETGYIKMFQKGALNYFTKPSTSAAQITGIGELYNAFKYIPDIANIYTDGLLMTQMQATAELVGAAPASPNANQVAGKQIIQTPPDDLFAKALTAWELERKWMKEFVGGLKVRVYEHQPVTDTIVTSGITTVAYNSTGLGYVAGSSDIFYPAEDLAQNITETVATFYIPTGVHPEEYILKDNVYHLYQEVAYYEKHELKRTVRYSPLSTILYSGSGGFAGLGTFVTIALLLAAINADSPGGAPHKLSPLLAGGGTGIYRYEIYDTGNNPQCTLLLNSSYNREVSYSWVTTQVFTPPCKLQYHAYIPPVFKCYNQAQEIVPLTTQPALTNPDYYCRLDATPRTKPKIGAGGYSIPTLQSSTGEYAGGVRYTLVDGTPAVAAYGGVGAVDGQSEVASIPGITAFVGIDGGPPLHGSLSPLIIDGIEFYYPAIPGETLIFPGGTFLIQKGSAQPAYPTLLGAFVFDLQYKRWGKQQGEYKHLLDFTPINTFSAGLVPSTSFGVEAAILAPDGLLYSFDANPTSSQLKWGKIGITRLGETSLEEVICQFGLNSIGVLSTETSLRGKYLSPELDYSVSFVNTKQVELKKGTVGKWHNLILSGQWDVVYMEYRAYPHGRR